MESTNSQLLLDTAWADDFDNSYSFTKDLTSTAAQDPDEWFFSNFLNNPSLSNAQNAAILQSSFDASTPTPSTNKRKYSFDGADDATLSNQDAQALTAIALECNERFEDNFAADIHPVSTKEF